MNDQFYKAFEDRYRGSKKEIEQRLHFYTPFLTLISKEFAGGSCIDLGCGRGEWLGILNQAGFKAQGVDLNSLMVQMCLDQGFEAQEQDLLEALKNLPDQSQVIVSAFHLIEHLPTPLLEQLIEQANRVLMPGGLLILETPNPENFSVGSFKFYMDPTHLRPINPLFLDTLVEFSGFEKTCIARLQEWPHLHGKTSANLFDVLWGASPDFAVIAVKGLLIECSTHYQAEMAQLLTQAYGLSSEHLAQRFDQSIKCQYEQMQLQIHQLQQQIDLLESTPFLPLKKWLKNWCVRLRRTMN